MDTEELGRLEEKLQRMDDSLEGIERTLDQMLVLAELSSSDMNVDREALQKTLDRLRIKLNCQADRLDALQRDL